MSAATTPAPATPAPANTSAPTLGPLAVQPYLSFEGRCDEAIAFYREVLGAQVNMVSRFGDMPRNEAGCAAPMPPADKVMHASLKVGGSEFFATDGQCKGKTNFAGIALSLPVSDVATCKRIFDAMAAKGSVQMPLSETFFAHSFGMVSDPFGVQWMIIVPKHP